MNNKKGVYITQIILALAVGVLSAFITRGSFGIFDSITKPPLSPPGIVFPIVWTILYTLMGISTARVRISGGRVPFIYYLQLAVNFLWPIFFFNMQVFLFAFVWLLVLWGLILAMIFEFYQTDKIAAYLQIPYLLWVSFAGYLNFMIWFLN